MSAWGVWDGSSVREVADGPSAFRGEAALLARRYPAQAVRLNEMGVWEPVPPGSVFRPAPAPPAQPRRVVWYDRVGRGGRWLGWLASWWPRSRPLFGRRRL